MKRTHIMRMYKYLAAIILIAVATSCKPKSTDIEEAGGYVSRQIDVTEFIAVQSEIASDIHYRDIPSGRQVVISAPKELIDKINVLVDNGILIISYKDKKYVPEEDDIDKITVKVCGSVAHAFYTKKEGDLLILGNMDRPNQRLEMVSDGNGDVKATGTVKCNELVLESTSYGDVVTENVVSDKVMAKSTGQGDIRAKGLNCGEVKLQALDDGDVTARGKCELAEMTASNHGDIFAQKLIAEKVEANAEGDCMIRCNPIDELKASTKGKGKIVPENEPNVKRYAPGAKVALRSSVNNTDY